MECERGKGPMTSTKKRDEAGFTLVELMAVVAVLGVLVAVAVPALLRAQSGAKEKAAQSNVRTALSAAKSFYTQHQNYWITSDADTLQLFRAAEPSLGWVGAMGSPSGRVNEVSWASTSAQVVLAVRASNGDCFFVRDITDLSSVDAGTTFGKTVGTDALTCDADGAAPVWKRSQSQGWPRDGASS